MVREAFPRWMEEDGFEADPPSLVDKLAEARQGNFRPHDPMTPPATTLSPLRSMKLPVEESDFIFCDVQDIVRYLRRRNPATAIRFV